MNALTLVLLVLATYRLARIVPLDTIAEGVRRRLTLWAFPSEPRPWRMWPFDLLTCPVCSGWWLAGAVTALWGWLVGPWWGWAFLVAWPAVAGGQTLVHFIERRLDHAQT